jgi:predicted molibdopterin-dependent oxidoreductase YjgC
MSTPEITASVTVDGVTVDVAAGTTAIAAIVAAGTLQTRRSITGQARFALCGIGQCQECRVTIDGKRHVLACRTECKEGMRIVTGDPV